MDTGVLSSLTLIGGQGDAVESPAIGWTNAVLRGARQDSCSVLSELGGEAGKRSGDRGDAAAYSAQPAGALRPLFVSGAGTVLGPLVSNVS
jgi:hypothetical protein